MSGDWFYLPNGVMVHRRFRADGGFVDDAACGITADADYWRGTGSQDEYDRAASLPKCRRCKEVMA